MFIYLFIFFNIYYIYSLAADFFLFVFFLNIIILVNNFVSGEQMKNGYVGERCCSLGKCHLARLAAVSGGPPCPGPPTLYQIKAHAQSHRLNTYSAQDSSLLSLK